ncbi:hypothetical protein JNB88_31295 [Rhizobium cauense]|uniref:hypothetical protein n=1 Tax=Rhizobium cauense TaxID=1166683 RepID=UPI001C6E5F5F|nr:hypothetical protein [Rhizobium cauense]MBW9118101.1 hypothetical protein [Rhizobium cauense]
MSDRHERPHFPVAMDLSVVALVVVLAALLYIFGATLSGDTQHLTDSVRGASIFDTRTTPN